MNSGTTGRSLGIASLHAALAILSTAGCKDFNVPDYNNSSIEDLTTNPTASGIASAAIGLIRTSRDDRAGEINTLGIYGRESYNIQVSEPRTVTSTLIGPLVQQNGGGLMFGGYQTIRSANIILEAVDKVSELSDAQKEGVRGFTKVWEALAFLRAIEVRERLGIPLDVAVDATGDPAPIANRDAVYARITQLLGEARAHLAAAGGAFYFALPSGFEDFDTPEQFAKFAAGLQARALVYHGEFGPALDALSASFVDTTADLDIGVYYPYSTNAGDAQNPLADPVTRFAHDSVWAQAEERADESKDLRVQRKLVKMSAPFSLPSFNITTNYQYKITAERQVSAPLPEMRNEELVLLRAEANIGLTHYTDAIKDINAIRVKSGGLQPIPDPYPGDILSALLYEKRYSLLWEGHRWLDLLHYDRLSELPKAAPNHKIFDANPYPVSECAPRDPEPEGCRAIDGF
jgi:hypothetical protein